jgi:hypothetical protein
VPFYHGDQKKGAIKKLNLPIKPSNRKLTHPCPPYHAHQNKQKATDQYRKVECIQSRKQNSNQGKFYCNLVIFSPRITEWMKCFRRWKLLTDKTSPILLETFSATFEIGLQ